MSNGTHQTIRQIIESGEIPQKVSNQLIFSVMLETYKEVAEMKEQLVAVAAESADTTHRVRENPSLVWYLRYQTKRTLATIVLTLAMLLWLIEQLPDVPWLAWFFR